MPRTEVYQLRLTPDEKATLARKGKARGLSVAQMIREDYGLTPRQVGPVAEPQEVENATKNLQDLINGHSRFMPLANAEALARKELGR